MKKLDKKNVEDITALTPMQEGMLYHYLQEPGSQLYFEQLSLEISGKIDLRYFKQAWNAVVAANEMLRTLILWEKVKNPIQVILKQHTPRVIFHDISTHEDNKKKQLPEEIKAADKEEAFALTEVPFRVILCKVGKEKYHLLVSNHHILYDGWSSGIIVKEFFDTYHALQQGKTPGKPVKAGIREFIGWHKARSGEKAAEEKYWKQYLADLETGTGIPLKQEKPLQGQKNKEFRYHREQLEPGTCKLLKSFTTTTRLTPTTVFYCAWGLLLQRYIHAHDVIFGITVSGRKAKIKGIENTVGLFINTQPLRLNSQGADRVEQVLNKVNRDLLEREANENTPLGKIKEYAAIESNEELFDTLVVVENYPVEHQPQNTAKGLSIKNYQIRETSNFDLTLSIRMNDWSNDITMVFSSPAGLFRETVIKRISRHLIAMVREIITTPGKRLSEIDMLAEPEKKELLSEINKTNAHYPREKTIHQLFEEQSNKNPDQIALAGIHETPEKNYNRSNLSYLSYRVLNQKSRQLACTLQEKGVKPETIAGIMVEPSLEMIIGILAILKAGGAYLPIDPEYPQERIQYMLNDSNAKILLTIREISNLFSPKAFNNSPKGTSSHLHLSRRNAPTTSLAYIIYTSGTTGKPKGVLIQHREVVRLMINDQFLFEISSSDVWTMFHSYCFDFSVWEMYGALLYGGKLIIIPKMIARDTDRFIRELKNQQVTVLNQTPRAFYQLAGRVLENKETGIHLRYIIFGGEALKPTKLKAWQASYPGTKLINMYGITETTVHVTFKEITAKEIETGRGNIGKPIPTSSTYIMDRHIRLAPPGADGELLVGGEGVARGYLNQPELTAEKFIENPYKPAARLYRSGDRVRQIHNKEMEYRGRIDNQVKIRGFRIELGEIEKQLLEHSKVKQAVVTTVRKKQENHLCAYIVPAKDTQLKVSQLREYLGMKLPAYMKPAYFVMLDRMPLTPNGKIDGKALPAPQAQTEARFEMPRDELEKRLQKIWQWVLGVEKIGINDNFFEIGGDSIKAIQVSGIIRKYGLKLEIKDMLLNPTIKEAARYVRKIDHEIRQAPVQGRVELTPIQQWYFENHLTHRHHFNHSLLLENKKGIDEEIVKKVFTAVIEHHDALRMKYKETPGGIVQVNRGIEPPLYDLDIVPINNSSEIDTEIELQANRVQDKINLQTGPLVKLVLFKIKKNDRLLIVIHHLVVDGISWRILLEDITTAYRQVEKGEKIRLKKKTASFQHWARQLKEYSQTPEALKELEHWKTAAREKENLPVDKEIPGEMKTYAEIDRHEMKLPKQETRRLLREIHHAYNTRINDILLTALALALGEWTGLEKAFIYLEGHGREPIMENMEISRTVGWYTSLYPVILETGKNRNLSYKIKSIKETLRRTPKNGIGYGILKYLTPGEKTGNALRGTEPGLTFNYLGELNSLNSEKEQGQRFKVCGMNIGSHVSPQTEHPFKLEIYGMVTGGKLTLYFAYNKHRYNKETIEKLAAFYRANLETIIHHCLEKEERELTPSDTGNTRLTIAQLEELENKLGKNQIQKIYNLTPTQRGMLYHIQADSTTKAYIEQLEILLKGKIEKNLLEKSLEILVNRHDILRTCFITQQSGEPWQVVLQKRTLKIGYEDISSLSRRQRDRKLEKFKEEQRQKGYDLTNDPLMRINLFKTGRESYVLVWNFHHIIMDGWSMGILFKEMLRVYRALEESRPMELEPVRPYRDYIRWQEGLDRRQGLRYWQKYLEGYGESTGIPKQNQPDPGSGNKKEEIHLKLDKELSTGLEKLARNNQVTVNTVYQVLWGILLQRYANQTDVVFGMVVSGRNPEVRGIERMVGLFINTIPVRYTAQGETSLRQTLKNAHKKNLLTKPYEHVPLVEIQANHPLKNQLLDHILVFENYPLEEGLRGKDNERETGQAAGFRVEETKLDEQSNYDLNIAISPGQTYTVNISIDTLVYDREMIRRIAHRYVNIIKQVVENPKIKEREIEILTKSERAPVIGGI
jgi:amino acid adenylation domain-containing protein/non-ribosomal peptide synthase protein (TIGR01720 family)